MRARLSSCVNIIAMRHQRTWYAESWAAIGTIRWWGSATTTVVREKVIDWIRRTGSDWVFRTFASKAKCLEWKNGNKSILINISTAKHSQQSSKIICRINSPTKLEHQILYDSGFIVGAECLKDDKKLLGRAESPCNNNLHERRAPLAANIRYTRCNHNKKLCNFFSLASSKVQKYNSFFLLSSEDAFEKKKNLNSFFVVFSSFFISFHLWLRMIMLFYAIF